MMHVGHVGVAVACRLVRVHVTVLAFWHRIMEVVVMSVVVPMGMLMLHGRVRMLVLVPLVQVHDHADQHQQSARTHAPAEPALPQPDRQGGADERGEGKHRPRSRRAEGPWMPIISLLPPAGTSA